MTAGIDEAPWQHGDLVTVASTPLRVVEHEGPWVEAVLPGSAVGFTVHQDEAAQPLKVGSLFTGYGGLDMAARAVFGGDLAWVCDNHPSAVTLLQHRHPKVPNLGDITAVDWSQVEPVDLLAAGFPCTDISNAGERAGIEGAQSGLWSYVVDAIRVLRPQHVLLENVSALLVRGLGRVAADLAALGYDLRWVCLRASDIGAPHRRDRWFGYATPAQDTDRATRGERRLAAPGQAQSGRARADAGRRGGAPAADTNVCGRGEVEPELRGRQPHLDWSFAADSDRGGQQGLTERHSEPHGARQGARGANPDGHLLDWGQFEPSIRRWENLAGRPAPEPTQPGRNGQPVLSPRFVEWLMGLPAGWVTDVPGLSRSQHLRLLGNGVVPQQGEAAIWRLLQLDALTHAA